MAEVVDAAARVFARKGYTSATVQDVADELGILKGSLYYYIDRKEELLFLLLMELHDEVDALLDEVVQLELAPLERLRCYVERQLAWNLCNLARVAVYYNDFEMLSREHRAEVVRRRRAHEDFIADTIREGQADGVAASSVDPDLLANLVFAPLIWPYRWCRRDGSIAIDAIASGCADFILGGMIGPSRPQAAGRK
jgi:AcrR family transcriptional regulator